MTERVDFYVLRGADARQRLHVACRVTEKAYLRGLPVLICGDSADELQELDELLWTFSDRSFVPHALCREAEALDPATPVHLTAGLPAGPLGAAPVLVNLAAGLPQEPARFARIAEIIDADPERRRLGRERFKAYRDLQFAIETHQLDDSTV